MEFDKVYKKWEQKKTDNIHNIMEQWLEKNPPSMKDNEIEDKDVDMHLSQGRLKKLREMEPQASLDLHGYTVEEAEMQISTFLQGCKAAGLGKVLIIHGKGVHSDEGPVLKKKVRQWVEQCTFTGQIGNASKKYGGDGAIWVILRR